MYQAAVYYAHPRGGSVEIAFGDWREDRETAVADGHRLATRERESRLGSDKLRVYYEVREAE